MAHDSSLQEYHDSESKNLVSNPFTRVRDLQLPGTSHKLMNLIQSDKKSELIMAEGGGGGGRERGVLQLSPKSVITDIRSLVSKSPDSFSSSSSSRREYCDGVSSITAPAAGAAALIVDGATSTSRRRTGRSKWLLPSRHDRGYSISDVEDQIMSDSSDQSSSLFDSSNASSSSEEILATAKIGALESLPEMHSLTLEASVLRPPRDLHALLPASSSLTAAPSRKSPATNVVQIDTQASTKSSDRWEAAAAAAANTDDYSAEFNRKLSCFRRSTHWGAGGGGGVLAHTRSLQGKVMSSAAKSESTASATTEQSDNVAMPTTLRQGAADHPSNCSWVPMYSATSMDRNIFGYSDRTPQRFFPAALQHHEPAAFSDSSSSPVAAAHGNLTAGSPGAAASCHGNYGFFYSPAAGASVPKPIPSKWDDAEKWIRSPGHQQSPAHPRLLRLPVLMGSETGKPFLVLKTSSHPTNANRTLHENVVFLTQKAEIHPTHVSKLYEFSSSISKQDDYLVAMKEIGTDPPTPRAFHTPRPSLGHRDMGTQMTPAESQRNSMCPTPKFVTSPGNNSPACLGTPSGTGPMGGTVVPGLLDLLQLKSCHLAKLELHKLANDEHPMIDRNPTSNTEQDDKLEHTRKLCQYDLGAMEGGILVSKATAWKQVELAKCTTRYNHEQAKILAWEALEKSKADTKLKKMQVKLEKKWLHAIEKMQERVAAACRKAEEMRAAAETHRQDKAAKTAAHTQQINTGQLPLLHKVFRCCISS
ncbi:unnamed protein product [Sphagnum jensenii]|uniref:Remorin C-terminal domain-containing protein n=1 Tax=Sphagnum jensenii TaxID=128206 RepID=A0ABP1AL18_9BRYO